MTLPADRKNVVGRPVGVTTTGDEQATAFAFWQPFLIALRAPRVCSSLLAGQIWAVGVSMLPLGTLLLVRHGHGSLASASLVLGASTLMTGIAAPVTARWVDRAGMARPLFTLGCAHGFTLAALIASVQFHAPLPATVTIAALAGALRPPIIPALRTLLADEAVDTRTRRTSFSMLALLQEFALIIGPALVAFLAALASPVYAVGQAATLAVGGACLFARTPAVAPTVPAKPARVSGDARMWALLAVSAFCGALFGSLDVSAPVFGDAVDDAGAAGLLLSALSAGIAIGSYAQGARPLTGAASTRIAQAAALATLATGLTLAVAKSLVALGPIFALGLCLSAVLILQSEVIEEIAPSGAGTQLGAYAMTAFAIGAPAGTVLAGVISNIERGPFLIALGAAALATSAALLLATAPKPRE